MYLLSVPDVEQREIAVCDLYGWCGRSPSMKPGTTLIIRWHTRPLRLRLPDAFWTWAEAEAGHRLMPVDNFIAEWLQVWYVDRTCGHKDRTPALPHGADAPEPDTEEEREW